MEAQVYEEYRWLSNSWETPCRSKSWRKNLERCGTLALVPSVGPNSFSSKDDFIKALTRGLWSIFGRCMVVRRCSPEFRSTEPIRTTATWERIIDLPLTLYEEKVLLQISSGIGRPIRVDHKTLYTNTGKFTRVCIEVNLEQTLKGTIAINGSRYLLEDEGLPTIRFACGRVGHLKSYCTYRHAEEGGGANTDGRQEEGRQPNQSTDEIRSVPMKALAWNPNAGGHHGEWMKSTFKLRGPRKNDRKHVGGDFSNFTVRMQNTSGE
ncbi:hypothetical protein V2J09_013823 [Rumex salicifolius]